MTNRSGWPWTEESPRIPAQITDSHRWPRISIVTPSYNQGSYIEETIRSILLQGYPDLEYIVIDGGSTDGSIHTIKKYEKWISYLRIGPDDGQADAISEGFRNSKGEILAWLNSDDRYQPGALLKVERFFAENPKTIFGNGDVNYIDKESRIETRIFAVRPNNLITSNLGMHVWPQQGCFWRSWAYHHVGGINSSLSFCMDRDLFLRLTAIGKSKRIPGPPLADFRVHDEAKSSTILEVAEKESMELIEKYGNPFWEPRQKLLAFLWNIWRKPTSLRARLNETFNIEF